MMMLMRVRVQVQCERECNRKDRQAKRPQKTQQLIDSADMIDPPHTNTDIAKYIVPFTIEIAILLVSSRPIAVQALAPSTIEP